MNRTTMIALGVLTLGVISALLLRLAGEPSGHATGTLQGSIQVWTYPPNDAVNVPFAWDGKDAPQPMAPPEGYPSGPVITLQATRGAVISVSDAVLIRESDGSVIESTILTSENDGHLTGDVVSLIPHKPLDPTTTYTVEVRGEISGEPLDETWSFTTHREGCDLLAQDCRPGQACYLLSTGLQCLWAGRSAVGGPCEYPSQCMAGLTCMGTRCVPFCDSRDATDDPTVECSDRCNGGVLPVPGAEAEDPVRLCILASCLADPSVCGDGESCVWMGDFMCAKAGQGAHGTPCSQATDCAAGTSCLGHEGTFGCHTLCGGPHMPDCESSCPGEALLFDAENKVSFCP